jgi:hypothetical protein
MVEGLDGYPEEEEEERRRGGGGGGGKGEGVPWPNPGRHPGSTGPAVYAGGPATWPTLLSSVRDCCPKK